MSAPACSDIGVDFVEARLGRVLQLPDDKGWVEGYSHRSLMEFFTEERIRDLIRCSCKRCPALCKPDVDKLVPTIRNKNNSYVGVLSFLLRHSKWRFIFGFIEKGFTDQKLSTLDIGDLPQLPQDEFNQMLSLEATVKSTEYINFFHFFMPELRYQDRSISEPKKIHPLQILPLNVTKRIGEGGYSTVCEAEILPGYHDFEVAKDGKVALKIFSHVIDGNLDFLKEMDNNVRYSHPRVMPLQAAIVYRGTHMHIFPLAEKCLKVLFDNDPPNDKGYTAKDWWNEFAELLGALHHIHTGRPGEAGFHFDLKPRNILICNGEWVITDLGLGHHKIVRELGQSKTAKKVGTDEYAPPEMNVGRSYDVFAMGCIGCEILVWLKDGAAGIPRFRENRKHVEGEPGKIQATVYNFHCGKDVDDLQPAVKNVLLEAKNEGGLSKAVAEILEDMLIHEDPKTQKKRPTAFEAVNRFKELLGQTPVRSNARTENAGVNNHKHPLAEVPQSSEQSHYLAAPRSYLKRPRSQSDLSIHEPRVLLSASGDLNTESTVPTPEIRLHSAHDGEDCGAN
ncbi:kinase-like protein [Wilcoxina mikolae CBS 423.85]|nr:kinase-like protein [Wilcoxina mikolae CBS 423.85]